MAGSGGPIGGGARRFATTRWSLVLAAGQDESGAREVALAELCSRYWYPLYSYARSRGSGAEDARDLTQAFFVKLLEKSDLGTADRHRGRFRTFLLTAMKNFMAGEWRKEQALKRGGGVELLSLDFDSAEETYRLEPSSELNPEQLYERRWALELLQRAVADLEAHYAETGRGELFEALKGSLMGEETVDYSELAKQLERSEGALRTAASRLRSRWRERLRELVADTVADESEVSDEVRSLITSVGRV